MSTIPYHTVRLQDGSLCNFRKRIWRRAKSLLSCFTSITDPRKKRGIRHNLSLILFILFAGITSGSTTLKDCHLWAIHNRKFLRRHFLLLHGIPDPTTIAYLLQQLNPEDLMASYTTFIRIIGVTSEDIISFDGKTMRAVTGTDSIRHILSLFSHLTHSVLSQIGVEQKENEIPAFRRLISKIGDRIGGFLFIADALHAQIETARAIIEARADYLLVIKGNQGDFYEDILTAFTDREDLPGTNYHQHQEDQFIEEQLTRKRDITTTVTVMHDQAMSDYLIEEHGFDGLKTIGVLKRQGARESKDGTKTQVNETICFVSSKMLKAKEAASLFRNHWCIENNLHWVKDFVFLEDRQTLRSGNAPQIMSFLRSMCISICNLVKFQSISDAIHNFQKTKSIHYQFLRMAAIV